MSEPIKVGDLVVIVRGHSCSMERYLGMVFVVAAIRQARCGGWHCPHCNRNDQWGPEPAAEWVGVGNAPLSWLKRIPPLSELEGQRTEETLRLPRKEPA